MNPNNTASLKHCTKCNIDKTTDQFSNDKTRKDGLSVICKECKKIYSQLNREVLIQRAKEWQKKHPRRSSASVRAWEKRNPEKRKAYVTSRRARHRDRENARSAVGYAMHTGKLPRANSAMCSRCREAQARHWHHHNGYDKEHRLDVVALCAQCHGLVHRVVAPKTDGEE